MTPIAQRIIDSMSTKPCACSKRPCGDQQELVGEVKTSYQLLDGFAKDITTKIHICQLRCQVCGDVHQAQLMQGEVTPTRMTQENDNRLG